MSDSRRASAAAQLVEHVARDGSVIEVVTRAEMRRRHLRHRSVYVAVLDDDDRLLVHERADWKDVFPGAWDLAFGGVCDVGEPWHTAAVRELREEAGVESDLVDHGDVAFEAEDVALIGRLYSCRHTGPFTFDDGEVTDTKWVPLDGLADFVAANTVPDDSAVIITADALRSAGSTSDDRTNQRSTAAQRGTGMTIDLTRAAVQPAGADGVAARTAAGFIVLASRDAAEHVAFIDEHQTAPNLIELLAARVTESAPTALAMLFTAGGEPYLFAWGTATASVTSTTSRFTVTPVAGELLVHPLAVDPDSRVVLSNGPIDPGQKTAAINLAEGSMQAQAVVVDLAPRSSPGGAPLDLPPIDLAAPAIAPMQATTPEPAQAPIEATTPEPAPAPAQAPIEATTPEPAETTPMQAAAPAAAAFTDATEILTEEALAALGQPAADKIVFADDLADIGDPLETEVVPDTQRIGQGLGGDAQAPPAAGHAPPPMPDDGAVAEIPPEFVRDAPAAEPAVDPLETTPLPDRQQLLEPPAPVGAPVLVLGASCPNGHHNHPEATVCTTCGAAMRRDQTVILVNGPRPPLGLLVVDDGTTVSIDHDLVIGRDPMANEDVRSGRARPMSLSDDTLALSRQHARIVLADWTVSIADLASSNGTWVNRGESPQDWSRVDPASPVVLRSRDRLRIGGRVIQVELHHPG